MYLKAGSEKRCDVIWYNPGNTASSENLCSKSELPYFWKLHCVNFETYTPCDLLLSCNEQYYLLLIDVFI